MWKFFIWTCAFLITAEAYHILCIFSIPSKSHNHLGKGIVNALLKAGHEVTWVTPYPPKKEDVPNGLKIIDGSVTRKLTEGVDMNDRNSNRGMSFIREFAANISEATVNIPKLREAIVNNKYDAVFTETFFSDMEAGYAAVLQVPWLVLSGVVMQPTLEALVDEVRTVSTIPLLFNDYPIPMDFWQRLFNVGLYAYLSFDNWRHYDRTLQLYTKSFTSLANQRGVQLPPLSDAIYNISILFVNSHSSFAPAQSLPPNVVNIGGFHIDENVQPLPKDLQTILDSSTQGVVYFSMGSVLKSSALPQHTREGLLKMLGELPYTVLWKFEEELSGLPKNVHIRPWMPQPAILAHKNTKVFITHGGLLSTLESLKYGVALITVPVFGDQPANAARAVRSGYAVRVSYKTDTLAGELRDAIKETMGTDKYYKKAQYLSFLFNKRPIAPSKLIAHYVEVAIETKGAPHLRSKALEYTWYQRAMLDVVALVLLSVALVYKLLQVLLTKLCKRSKNKVKKN